jgi:hypothetical protein
VPIPSSDAAASLALMPPRPPRAVVRAGLGALALTTLLSGFVMVDSRPAAGASSCTGWTSHVVPPRTIRVLRTGIGRVQRVPFRRYVAEVMASGEWPSRLHMVTLEAGAVATKQYAWYYAMRGHHRPHYRHNGRCYDVRDDTADQLFRPERARPSGRQTRAIDATWGLSLRKFGRFFLTGYRAGGVSSCASDANGWKLYAQSVEACARQGWSRERIQRTYLGPRLSFVWSPRVGPILHEPVIYLRAGNSMPHDAVSVSWKPDVVAGGITHYTLQRKVGRGDWQSVWLARPHARKIHVWLKTGVGNRFRIRATDHQGRTGPWAYSADRTAALRGPIGLRLSSTTVPAGKQADRRPGKREERRADTRAERRSSKHGGRQATHSSRARIRFTGRSVALVARTGPGAGRAKVFLDGKRVAIVDLERPTATSRELVWARNLGRVKPRTIAVTAADRGSTIDFRGFYVLR